MSATAAAKKPLAQDSAPPQARREPVTIKEAIVEVVSDSGEGRYSE